MNSANREEKKYNPEDITINGETWLSCSCGHHLVIDGIIARVKSQTRNDLLREIMEEMPKKRVVDISDSRTIWQDEAFNLAIDQVNTILERKMK